MLDGIRSEWWAPSDQNAWTASLGIRTLRDPRQSAKVLYPLPEVLLLLLCATISGADDFVEITLWGEERLDFLRRFQLYEHGIPSHDTLCDVVAAIDPEMFKACFLAWVEGLRGDTPDMIAIDGKTSRRSHARSKGRLPLHTVSAWASRQRLVLGQEAVAEKSNEITAIPILLQRLELAGALVTIDAMGTQTEIAQTILDGGGDYVLALKENWPATYAEVDKTFAVSSPALNIQRSTTVDGDHGRIETRRHAICHDIDWMLSDRRYPGELKFPGLAAIGMVESETERGDKIERQKRYYLCSTKLDVETFARVVRGHWGIENRLHWVLDVVFRDDLARLRSGHGPANMAVIKHTALNLLTQAKPITSLKNRRKKAGWNQDYLLNVVTGTAYVIQAIPLDRPGTDLAMRPWLRETDALGQRGYAMDAPWQPAAGSG
jgi:predicted transposase YbfD/YdcC